MKTVLITGAAGGIGAATASVFAREGWHVIGIDLIAYSESSICDEFLLVDLADELEIERLIADVAQRYGGLDALVNNAAIQLCKPLLEMTGTEWDSLMAVNLRAAFLMMRCAYPLLRTNGGAIVNVGSIHSHATSKNIAAYASSKGGLEALTRAAALEFAADGIRVNSVHPGAVATKMLEAGLERGPLSSVATVSQLVQLGQKHPLGRIGQPGEIGETILFLADGQRSSFITGTVLVVDGGALARLSTE